MSKTATKKRAVGAPVNSELAGPSLLIPERPLYVLPTLATRIGLERAVVLQQIYWMIQAHRGVLLKDGKRYVFNSYEEWTERYFPFISHRTLARIFQELEKDGYLASCQPEGSISRRKYYTIGREIRTLSLGETTDTPDRMAHDEAKLAGSMGPGNADQNEPNWPVPLSESTTKSTSQTKATPPEAADLAACPPKKPELKPEDMEHVFPQQFDTPDFKATWKHWVDARRRMRCPMTPHAATLLINGLSKMTNDANVAIEIINQSIERGWRGLFPVKNGNTKRSQPLMR